MPGYAPAQKRRSLARTRRHRTDGPYCRAMPVDPTPPEPDLRDAEAIFRREDYSYGSYQAPQDDAVVGPAWDPLGRRTAIDHPP